MQGGELMNKEFAGKTLIIEFEKGISDTGKPIYKRKSIKNISSEATDEQIYNVGLALANLYSNPIANIFVDEDYVLSA